MRLLEHHGNDEFSLTQDLLGNLPAYAILSHTWGNDGEEFTFEDQAKGTGKSKPGFRKIRFCGEQAERDGLRYFWVDTCCIDKSDAAELQTAINSMFQWYKNAARCYVYLQDVSISDDSELRNDSDFDFESAFRASRWFKRGWTLQELVAPSTVEFFSAEYRRCGDKKSLERLINEITEVPVEVLQGHNLASFNFNKKLSWVSTRETKREEDMVYSLLGIFGVFLPLNYGEGRDNALRRLRDEVERNFPSEKPAWIVPFDRNSRFTGRDLQLATLEQEIFGSNQIRRKAIVGLGGVGKTQLALELLYRVRDKYRNCSIIWIPATNMESLHQAYLDIARHLGISGCEGDKADAKRLVQSYLSKESAGQWLLVFDNADDIDMWIGQASTDSKRLIDYLPRSEQGCILFTSRNRKTAVKLAQQNILEVTEMDEHVATQLLQNCLSDQSLLVTNRLATIALLKELTFLPLAIVQAAAYINENQISFTDYLSLLANQEEEAIELLSEDFEVDGRYQNIKNPVAMTWLVSFDQIRFRDPLAADYLSFMACIDPKNIPQSLLPVGISKKKEIEAIGTLQAYSFIIKQPASSTFNLHRLVYLATRNWLRQESLIAQWTKTAIIRLEEVFPNNDHNNRSVWRIYLPHVLCVLASDIVDKDEEKRIDLAWRFGMCLYSDGRYNEAEALFTELMETDSQVLGPEDPDTLASIANLASTYWNQGRWKEAEDLEVQVMETKKRVLGPEHPSTLVSVANLASTYWNQGRLKEAEDLEVQVMETRKRVLGPEHPDTLKSMANLASTWKDLGRFNHAFELLKECVTLRTRIIGPDHPETLSCRIVLLAWEAEGVENGAFSDTGHES